jgi:A/G-specific adenine glycosylase
MDVPNPGETEFSAAWRRSLAKKLLAWFTANARDLPWRRTDDLYAIWVSEIMLQQTQVATVIPYWQRFLARFPTVAALAAADEQEVLRLWEGLGYYRRARQLHAAARQIVAEHGSQFPTAFAAVRELPGIGRYTAGAVLSIGRDERLPILEANTIRVFSRLTAFAGEPATTAGQKHLWSIAEALLPAKQCGAFNQALMELGSEVCTPKAPDCDRCPVATLCQARRLGLVEQIPRRAKRMNYEDVTEIAVIVHDRGRVLLRQCQPGERWAGLWDFPRFAASGPDTLAEQIALRTRELTGIQVAAGQQLATLKHGVTRFRITLHCYAAARQSPAGKLAAAARWVSRECLGEYPLNTTGRRISRLLDP